MINSADRSVDAEGATRRPPPRVRLPALGGLVIACLAVALSGLLADQLTGVESGWSAVIYNIAQLVAAALATLSAAMVVRRHRTSERRGWILVTIACGSWTLGQLYWSWIEIVVGEDVHPVSPADFFFITFTVLMVIAVMPREGLKTDRLRTLLDTFIIGVSLFCISWSTSINAVAKTADETEMLALIVNLSYPVGDIAVLTLVILTMSRRSGQRSSLTAVALGMGFIALSDGFYVYLESLELYQSGSPVGLGWVIGFGLIACAGLAVGREQEAAVAGTAPLRPRGVREVSVLPYIPLVLALVVVGITRLTRVPDPISAGALILVFFGVLCRQYLTIRDNAALARSLARREHELQRRAFQDLLTGLPNRALFTDRVAHALEQHRRNLRPLALLFVDLDDFKAVNDTLGHPVGDELVIRVAERLRGALRSSDTVARFGGDEFAVLAEGDHVDGAALGSRLVEALRPQFLLGKEELSIGASIGIAEVAPTQLTPTLDDLYSWADIAMYAAKRAGKGQIAVYEPSMVLPEAADLQYRPLLIDAIRRGTIECVFQPIFDLQTQQVHCMEALARWRVGDQPIPPSYFVQLAGRLKQLPALTDLMVDRACAQLADWRRRFDCRDLRVGVNVPPGLMTDQDFPRRIAAALRRHQLPADRLVLEVTEDALLGEAEVARAVADQLRRTGVRLWLDDFGTGYSSLLSLRQISLQAVKIDIAFVANIHVDPSAATFLRALLVLGRDLQLKVIAEGVELVQQVDVLRELGCRYVQGYLLARPAPAPELDHLLDPAAPVPAGLDRGRRTPTVTS